VICDVGEKKNFRKADFSPRRRICRPFQQQCLPKRQGADQASST
jgi:hypothetical protein